MKNKSNGSLDPSAAARACGSILPGDCLDVPGAMPADSVDLIVTAPPYADARTRTYGGVSPDEYVDWFSPRATEMLCVLKPTGSFVLNIKEKAVEGERYPYVLDLILHLERDIGFRWVEEYIWHKTTAAPGKWRYRLRDAWERILHFDGLNATARRACLQRHWQDDTTRSRHIPKKGRKCHTRKESYAWPVHECQVAVASQARNYWRTATLAGRFAW